MKNIHILSTENSSRLSYNENGVLELNRLQWRKGTQNIYITNDEEIKKPCWVMPIDGIPYKLIDLNCILDSDKKIILTTDQDLIKDGVQAIDDEFLEWFVKNPSCEFVNIESYKIDKEWDEKHTQFNPIYPMKNKYKINIPQEEPKQECKDCNNSLEDCTCIEDTIDMKQETLEQAKEMEKQQQDELAIGFIKWCENKCVFSPSVIHRPSYEKLLEYYRETI
jgi:hypothetical protein